VRAFDPLFISLNLRINSGEVETEVCTLPGVGGEIQRTVAAHAVAIERRNAAESSFLIDAHLLILQDRLFVDRIIAKIESDRINAEWAIQQVTDDLCEAYDRLDDDYLRERRGDLDDIVRRLLHNLQSKHLPPLARLPYDAVVVGRSIPASALFELRSRHIAGLVTETGSSLSHTAIMARSMEIPTVMGVEDLPEIPSGALLVVDGSEESSSSRRRKKRWHVTVKSQPRKRNQNGSLPPLPDGHASRKMACGFPWGPISISAKKCPRPLPITVSSSASTARSLTSSATAASPTNRL